MLRRLFAVIVTAALCFSYYASVGESFSLREHEGHSNVGGGLGRVISKQTPTTRVPKSSVVFSMTEEEKEDLIKEASKNYSSGYESLRIGSFAEDVNNSEKYCTQVGDLRSTLYGETVVCTFDDILTKEKKEALLREILPFAVKMHTSRLLVQPVVGSLKVSSSSFLATCGEFSIPDSHRTDGVANYDFLLYVAAAPTTDSSIAWATHCTTSANGRPLVGVASISPRYIYPGNTESSGRVLAHEIGHALGFALNFFKARGMTATATNIRGKPDDVPVLVSSHVVKAGRAFFGWKDLEYVELEDEGGTAVKGSHWKRRNLKDDLMSGIAGENMYSILTLAAFEDLGFYRVNYSKAEAPVWGYQEGETLLAEQCLINGNSQVKSLFCSQPDGYLCTADRLAYGKCEVGIFDSMLPAYSRYFEDPNEGGVSLLMDYCPSVQRFANTGCRDGTEALMPGSVISPTSLCLEGNGDIEINGHKPFTICAPVQCDRESRTYKIKVNGSLVYVSCPENSKFNLTDASEAFVSGTITCPPYRSMCHDEPDLSELKKPMCLCKMLRENKKKRAFNTMMPATLSSMSRSAGNMEDSLESTNTRRRPKNHKRFFVKNGRVVKFLKKPSE